jgi:hypothetical protein
MIVEMSAILAGVIAIVRVAVILMRVERIEMRAIDIAMVMIVGIGAMGVMVMDIVRVAVTVAILIMMGRELQTMEKGRVSVTIISTITSSQAVGASSILTTSVERAVVGAMMWVRGFRVMTIAVAMKAVGSSVEVVTTTGASQIRRVQSIAWRGVRWGALAHTQLFAAGGEGRLLSHRVQVAIRHHRRCFCSWVRRSD